MTQQGYLGPFELFSPARCRRLMALVHRPWAPDRMTWVKGYAAADPVYWAVGADPRLLGPVRALLGPDVILWGATLVVRRPGQVHRWHTDIESADPAGGFASAWIGLDGVTARAGLKFIAGSHLFGTPVQQALAESGGPATDEAVLALARARDPAARLDQPEVHDGVAFIFDGRIWHGSRNEDAGATRTALLLQYAAADRPVRVPVYRQAWPFAYRARLRPPCVVVSGTAQSAPNRLVPPPAREAKMLDNSVHPLAPVMALDRVTKYQSFHYFCGPTPVVGEMESHASALAPGKSPHAPHAHDEEEILILLEGEADLVLPDGPSAEGAERRPIRPGEFVYYPANRYHTLYNTGDRPARYLMFKWIGPPPRDGEAAPTRFVSFAGPLSAEPKSRKFLSTRLIEEPTLWLDTLHAHVSTAAQGGGYRRHADAHDVAIVLLEGSVETLGRTVSAPALLFHPAGRQHGLRGAGPGMARYLVFEFHRSRPFDPDGLGDVERFRLQRTGYARLRRAASALLRRIRGKSGY